VADRCRRCRQVHGHLSSAAGSLSGQRHGHPACHLRRLPHRRADRAADAVDVRRRHLRLSDLGRICRVAVLCAGARSTDCRQQTQDDVRRLVDIARVPRTGRRTGLLQLLSHLLSEAV